MITNALITGGSGLLALNWALSLRDRLSVTLGLHEREISLVGVQSRQLVLDSPDQLLRTLASIQPQVVVHTVGLTSVEECEAKPDLARYLNVELAVNVAKACASLGLPLVHVSTDHLFDGKVESVDEGEPTRPCNVYGFTKAEAEIRVLEAHPQALVVRTNFYGWGPTYRRSFSDVIIDGLRSGRPLNLFQDVFYTPVLIAAATKAVHELIELKVSGIYHVVGDERISKYEFGLKVAKEFELDASLIRAGRLADQVALVRRPYDMSLSNRKLCRLLGRNIGGVDDHIAALHQQEVSGLAREMRNL